MESKRNKRGKKQSLENDASINSEEPNIGFAESDEMCLDFMTECANCGTIIEFYTDRCPICGKRFDVSDTGLVSLFSDMKFETDRPGEVNCPVCGDMVKPSRGKCPACKELIAFSGPKDPGIKVDPIIHDDNVVFIHLDVEAGEVNCLQRSEEGFGLERVSVHLENIGQGEFERGRKGVAHM